MPRTKSTSRRWWRARGHVAIALTLVALIAGPAAAQGTGVDFPAPTWTDTIGPVAISSPTVTTIGGVPVVMFGSENGYLYVVNADTGLPLPGWPRPVEIRPGEPSAIESTPTLAYVNGPAAPPLIVVGAGSTYVSHEQGGLVAFNVAGQIVFRFLTKDVYNEWSGGAHPDGYREGVISTPVVGDVTGTGKLAIVFGSWDHRLYAITGTGRLVHGFPIDTEDTIWSSAALYHVRGRAQQVDIFIGGDASGRDGCYGGFVYDITYARHAPRIRWQHCEDQTIWSSPAVGPLGRGGRAAVVVGTGFGEKPPYQSGSYRLFAFNARTGRTLRGWPVTTTGPTFGSPAVGDIGTNGLGVVDDSWCVHCPRTPGGASIVRAWSATGHRLWSVSIHGAHDFASPVLADLTGSGSNDVLVGSSSGLYPLDGTTGAFLFGTSYSTTLTHCSIQDAAAVADIPGTDQGAGWRLFVICGGPHQLTPTARLLSYPLPTPPAVTPPWPQWREGPDHLGIAPVVTQN